MKNELDMTVVRADYLKWQRAGMSAKYMPTPALGDYLQWQRAAQSNSRVYVIGPLGAALQNAYRVESTRIVIQDEIDRSPRLTLRQRITKAWKWCMECEDITDETL
jgi:hypothetical protein